MYRYMDDFNKTLRYIVDKDSKYLLAINCEWEILELKNSRYGSEKFQVVVPNFLVEYK